ncbi:hypothetical protein TcWFU_010280 [Taenia crassiceps]|uniref:Uncharacterized protein n=1 Tax=Taenia crassiceps TaxID=6207 RepID=A0ABR4QPQ2_9CEST
MNGIRGTNPRDLEKNNNMAPCLSELLVLVAKPAGSPKSSVVGSGFEAFSYGRFSLFGLLGGRSPRRWYSVRLGPCFVQLVRFLIKAYFANTSCCSFGSALVIHCCKLALVALRPFTGCCAVSPEAEFINDARAHECLWGGAARCYLGAYGAGLAARVQGGTYVVRSCSLDDPHQLVPGRSGWMCCAPTLHRLMPEKP